MAETFPVKSEGTAAGEITDLRRVGISPDFWYPVAVAASVPKEKTFCLKKEKLSLENRAGSGNALGR